jgi:hypothetical protein
MATRPLSSVRLAAGAFMLIVCFYWIDLQSARAESRYMEGADGKYCKSLQSDDQLAKHGVVASYIDAAKAANIAILICEYPFDQVPNARGTNDRHPQVGWVVLADPPSDMLTAWIKSACKIGAPAKVTACVGALGDYIIGQSGGQFPILGFVAEGGPRDDLCKQYSKAVHVQGLISFQDGVTVQRLASANGTREGIYCATDGWEAEIQQIISTSHPIKTIYAFARLSGLHRSCAIALIDESITAAARKSNEDEWLVAVRLNHLNALKTGRDRMMEIQAERFNSGVAFGSTCVSRRSAY